MVRVLALATLYNESDILPYTLPHLWANGVDEIIVAVSTASTDNTANLCFDSDCIVIDDDDPYHFQPKWINHLAEEFASPGDWIIPFDADEFHYAIDGRTLKEALSEAPSPGYCPVASYQHRDWNYRYPHMGMAKVAYRYEPGCAVANGNHSVDLPSGPPAIDDLIALREIQFRSADHLQRKSRERVARLDPSLPESEGHHQRILAPLDDGALADKWTQWGTGELIHDPIPVRRLP